MCETGKFASIAEGNGESVCSPVEAGQKAVMSGVLRVGQENCPQNHFSNGGADDCQPCEGGGHSEAGSPRCADTPPGHYYNGVTDVECVAGKFTASGASDESECEECGNGKFSGNGAAYCSTAPAGTKITFSNNLRVDREDCAINTFSTGANDDCAVCAEGGHIEVGSSSCVQTQPGQYFDEVLQRRRFWSWNVFF